MEEQNKSMNWMVIAVAVVVIVVIGYMLMQNRSAPAEDGMTGDDSVVVDDGAMMDEGTSDEDSMLDEDTMAANTIVDVAVADSRFTTLVEAVTAADLVETLSGEGPFTVFAPTDDAFAALPEGTLESLLADPAQLTSVLTYHVVPGEYMAEDVVAMDALTTVQGETLDVVVNADGTVTVGGANVVITDVEADNGVIHVIDAVLVPAAE